MTITVYSAVNATSGGNSGEQGRGPESDRGDDAVFFVFQREIVVDLLIVPLQLRLSDIFIIEAGKKELIVFTRIFFLN